MSSRLAWFALGSLLGLSGCVSKGDTIVGDARSKGTKTPETVDAGDSESTTSDSNSDDEGGDETTGTDGDNETPDGTDDVTGADATSDPDATSDEAPSSDEPATTDLTSDETSDPTDTETEAPSTDETDTAADDATDTTTEEPEEPEVQAKCTRHDPVQLTSNSSAKRGLGVATDGKVILASWQGLPSGTIKSQYILAANEDLSPIDETPFALGDVTGGDDATGYNEVTYSPSTHQFLVTWANYFGQNVYPTAQLISTDGELVDVTLDLGGFITFTVGGRHRTAWYDNKFFLGYYWCASGGSGCPYPSMDNPFNSAAWLLIDDETGAVQQPAEGGSPYPGAHNGTQILQMTTFSDEEAGVSGFLGLNYDGGSAVSLIQYHLDGTYASSGWLWDEGAKLGNNNGKSKFVWDGASALVFSQGNGYGPMQDAALRQERWDFTGEQKYVKKLTTKAIDPLGVALDGSTVSLLAGNDASLYFMRSTVAGAVSLEPEVIAAGDAIRSATLLHDDQGYFTVYLAEVDGTDQVMAARIDCAE